MTEELLTPPTPTMFRFPDEATWIAAGLAAGIYIKEPVLDDDGNETGEELKLVGYTHSYACDVVGRITRGGEWDPETGEVITPPEVLDGWHVNYLGPLPDGWEQYAVWPENPVRVWATASPPPGEGYVRARDEEGKFLPDDPATPDVNEAWVKV